jgi:hypothetical protein
MALVGGSGEASWFSNLVVGLVSLCVGCAALYFVVKNYQMAVTSNRPELASNGFHIQLASRRPLVAVDLLNSARRQPVGATPPYMPWPN